MRARILNDRGGRANSAFKAKVLVRVAQSPAPRTGCAHPVSPNYRHLRPKIKPAAERPPQPGLITGMIKNSEITEHGFKGRMESRLPIIVTVHLEHPACADTDREERAYTDNISPCGARVFSKHPWQPDDLVRIAPVNEESVFGRVVYCQRLPDERFCFGVEFKGGPVTWSILQRYSRS